jgi:apolipoprotein D and lipocalin family protein
MNLKWNVVKTTLLSCLLLLTACAGIPEGVEPVSGFDVQRYSGKWYEIARLDNWFEKGLDHITAEYNLNKDGSVSVTNSGFNGAEGKREVAYGKAYFIGNPNTGSLKVSFFGPFYGGYHIIELDRDYGHALIAGSNRDYLWILARQPALDQVIVQKLLTKAASLGFDTTKLVYPKQQ